MKKTYLFFVLIMISGLILSGCNPDNLIDSPASAENNNYGVIDNSLKLTQPTLNELARVKAATAKYHNIETAIQDGYADINLYMTNMGWHFLKSSEVDSLFEVEKPELLVYADKPGGGYRLVAVEYAVPLELSTSAPEGFTGDDDEWSINSTFGLWTLHAWVWYNNPDGMFNPTNPRVN